MKKFAILLGGLAMTAAAIPAAAVAAPAPAPRYAVQEWESINARQARLEARINQGIRAGTLTRREADKLRSEFRALEKLEYRYRRSGGGLSLAERRDLDRRFDALSAKIRIQKHDRDNRPVHR